MPLEKLEYVNNPRERVLRRLGPLPPHLGTMNHCNA